MTGTPDRASDDAPSAPSAVAWEDPPRPGPNEVLAPVLSVDGFEGPLDWLLELARTQKIDLTRLSIAALIDGFARALDDALARREDVARLARWADWLVMAATLAWLRSRLLLPAELPAATQAEDAAEALRRQLVGRARMRAAADWLEQRPQLGQEVFARGRPEVSASGRGADITALLRACLVALRVPEVLQAADRPRPPPLWTISDAIARIARLLPGLPDGAALTALLPRVAADAPDRALRCRAAVAGTLVGGLELARDGALTLQQDGAWTPIEVHRGNAQRAEEPVTTDRVA